MKKIYLTFIAISLCGILSTKAQIIGSMYEPVVREPVNVGALILIEQQQKATLQEAYNALEDEIDDYTIFIQALLRTTMDDQLRSALNMKYKQTRSLINDLQQTADITQIRIKLKNIRREVSDELVAYSNRANSFKR